MSWWLGVDVGGTKSASVLMDGEGTVRARDWVEHGRGPLVDIIVDSIRRLLVHEGIAPASVSGFGVAIAGLVSSDRRTIINAANLDAVDFPLADLLSQCLPAPVVLENDANATLLGHALADPSHQPGSTNVLLLLTLGTGVGGAMLVDGAPLAGSRGYAGELGHIKVDFDSGRLCVCGSPGCLANYASGRGLEELAALTPHPAGPSLEPMSSRHVVGLARQGDRWALGLLQIAGRMLGRGVTSLCVTLDPTKVILAGSFGHATHEWLIPAALQEMRRLWPFPDQRPLTEIQLDTIGPYAGATGAALTAKHHLNKQGEPS